ncbi:MAG: AbrB/MazE/SpoVT family DNA-binding domain-containing protein [Pyrinomonadaceae bacterium]
MKQTVKTKVTQGGRIVIPVEMRKQLGIEVGENVNLELDNGSLRITTRRAALGRIQASLRTIVPEGISLVDELIADRRREAENEKYSP